MRSFAIRLHKVMENLGLFKLVVCISLNIVRSQVILPMVSYESEASFLGLQRE